MKKAMLSQPMAGKTDGKCPHYKKMNEMELYDENE